MKNKNLNIIIITISFFVMLMIGFFTHGVSGMINLILKMNCLWLLAAFGCICIYWFIDGAILQFISKCLYEKQSFSNSLKATMICKFFDSITPFSSGGQPALAYSLIRDGIKPGHAASISVIKSTIYQTVVIVYSLVVLALKSGFFITRIHGFFYLYILGFILNLIVGVVWILLIYKRVLAYKLILFFFNMLWKIKIFRKIKKYEQRLEGEFDVYGEGALLLKNNVKMIIGMSILQVIGFTFFFAIPFFIYLSIDPKVMIDILDMVAAQSMVSMISSYIPSPGSSGAAEGSAYIFFSLFFNSSVIIPVILIWRVITFYSAVFFGGIVTVISHRKPEEINIE